MCMQEREGQTGKAMFWAALALTPLTILTSGHGRVEHFVTGAASALLALSVVAMVKRGCLWRR